MSNKYNKSLIISLCLFTCLGAGYKGSLPNLGSYFESEKKGPSNTKPIFNTNNQSTDTKFKKIPRQNPQYIDIILKKEKTSPYLNDLNDVILILEKMQKCIESDGNVQKFNAIASSIIDHADFIAEKYADSPEKYYISFVKLQEIAAEVRTLATLRCESQIYIKYLAYQNEGQIYNKENINEQISQFKEKLDITIRILKDAT